MKSKLIKQKRWWLRGILMVLFAVGMFFITMNVQTEAGTLQYRAEISSSTRENNITFVCNLNQTIDGQQVGYQWQENKGSGWQNIFGATGASYPVNRVGKAGYQYRCTITITVNNSYSLMNECYKAFLHRQGVASEFQHWWPYLYEHTQDEYLVTVYNALETPPQNEAARVAMEIVFSDEYMKKYKNNRLDYNTSVNGDTLNGPKQLIVDSYRFLLQREPSVDEVEFWYSEYERNNGRPQKFGYPDANNVTHKHDTYSGMGYVINAIAQSEECANKMAAAYHYDGVQGVFLYTESDIEYQADIYHVTSDVATIPEEAYRVILQKGTGIQSVTGAGSYAMGQRVTIDATPATGYHWKSWMGTYEANTKSYTFQMPAQDVIMTANAEINHSTLRIDPNGGSWNGSADIQRFRENYGTAMSIPDPVRQGYVFSGWVKSEVFHGSLNHALYTFGADDGAVDVLTASWTANSYTLHFDPNGGVEAAHIEDMVIRYDEEIILPDAAAAYVKYTFDGQNVTQDVLSGAIRQYAAGTYESLDLENAVLEALETILPDERKNEIEDETVATPATGEKPDDSILDEKNEMRAAQADGETSDDLQTETEEQVAAVGENNAETGNPETEIETEPAADRSVYASVNTGWVTEEEKENYVPQWTAGMQVSVADLIEASGVADQNGAMITLYASWDDCPGIVATNLYYTLEQAQQGVITDSEILSHATASDREDGSPIEAGFHENGTSFSIPDYQASDFTQFLRGGSCTENLTVVDSAGSIYCKQITVYVVDTTPADARTERTTRFIDEKYYGSSYERGGLLDDSIWKTDTAYVSALRTAFGNLENDAPVETYTINGEARRKIREYVDAHGFGDSREVGALQEMYDRYLVPNRVR